MTIRTSVVVKAVVRAVVRAVVKAVVRLVVRVVMAYDDPDPASHGRRQPQVGAAITVFRMSTLHVRITSPVLGGFPPVCHPVGVLAGVGPAHAAHCGSFG